MISYCRSSGSIVLCVLSFVGGIEAITIASWPPKTGRSSHLVRGLVHRNWMTTSTGCNWPAAARKAAGASPRWQAVCPARGAPSSAPPDALVPAVRAVRVAEQWNRIVANCILFKDAHCAMASQVPIGKLDLPEPRAARRDATPDGAGGRGASPVESWQFLHPGKAMSRPQILRITNGGRGGRRVCQTIA